MINTSMDRLQTIFNDLHEPQLVKMLEVLKDMNSFDEDDVIDSQTSTERLRDIAVAQACYAIAPVPEQERDMIINLLSSFKLVLEQ